MRIRLLGALEIDGEPAHLGRRDRVVLARLALAAGHAVTRDALVDALWGGDVPASADKVVQGAIVRLRRRLGHAAIETAASGYRLVLPPSEIDVLQFRTSAARARGLAAVGDGERAAHITAQALALWPPEDGDTLDLEGITPHEQLQLVDMRRTLEEEHLDLLLSMRGGGDLVERANELVGSDPHREQRWALLARAQYRAGRQADALRTLQRAQRTLRDDLGLDLSRQLADLEQRILRQDALLDVEPEGGASPEGSGVDRCPYRGLLFFDVDDSDVFFGRERAIGDALTRLAQHGSVVIVGPSGSGKSSVLRAGVVATLRAEGRAAEIVQLGTATPQVAHQLARLAPGTVVAVDQFEELFTPNRAQVADDELAALSLWRGPVILTLRSDHLDRVNGIAWLAELAERSLLLIRPPDAEDLRSAIVGPATASGLRLEPGLVELILRDVLGEPGALPLMSHALRSTWLGREGRTLTVEAYERAGGLHGSIAATADEVYADLDTESRLRMRRLMLRLFDVTSGSRPTRARVPMEAAVADARARELVDRLSAARLVVTGDDGLTVAHEALATAWPRLVEWLDDDRGTAQRRRHLTEAARTWDEMGRPDSELYRGARLSTAVEWRRSTGETLPVLEAAFLNASEATDAADRDRLHAELAERSRVSRRLARLSAVLVAMVLVAASVGGVAVSQSRRAGAERERAELASVETRRQALLTTASSLLASRRDLAALLLAEADRMRSDAGTRSALLGAFTATSGLLGYLHPVGPGPTVDAVAIGDDDVLVVDDQLASWIVGVDDPAAVATRVGDPLGPGTASVAVDRTRAVAALYRDPVDEPARLDLFDAVSHRRSLEVPVDDGFTSLAVSPGGEYVALAGGDGRAVQLLRTEDGEVIASATAPHVDLVSRPSFTAAVTFGPDGALYVAQLDGVVVRYSVPALEPLDELDRAVGTASPTAGLMVTDDGSALVAHGWRDWPDPGSVVARWDLASGDVTWTTTPLLPCQDLVEISDEGLLACTGTFGAIELISLDDGSRAGSTDAQHGRIGAIAALPDGRRYVSAGASEATVAVWDVAGAGPITTVDNETARYDTPVWFSPDGRHILAVVVPLSPFDAAGPCAGAAAFRDGSCFLAPDLIDAVDGTVTDPLDDVVAATWVGERLAFIGRDRSFGLYEVGSGAVEPVDPGSVTGNGSIVALDPEGEGLLFWLDDGTSHLFDATTNRFERSGIPAMPPRAAAFTADGERVAMVSEQRLRLVDVATGETVAGPLDGFDSVAAAGGVVVAGDRAGRVHVLDDVDLAPVLAPFGAGSGQVQEVEVSEDGGVVMARSGDAVRLFDGRTGSQLGGSIPVARPDPDEGAALRSDGARLAVTVAGGFAIWDLDPAAWQAAACRLAGRNLTRAEWTTYIGDLADYHLTCPDLPEPPSNA